MKMNFKHHLFVGHRVHFKRCFSSLFILRGCFWQCDALAYTGGRGAPRIFSRGRALPLGATLTGRARAPSKSQFSTPARDHQRSKIPIFLEKYLDLSMPKLFEAGTRQRKFDWGPRRYETYGVNISINFLISRNSDYLVFISFTPV